MNKTKQKIRYKAYSFRLDERTATGLAKKRKKQGKSWNLFFYNNLLKKDANVSLPEVSGKQLEV